MEAATAFHDYPRMATAQRRTSDGITERLVLLRRALAGDARGSQVRFSQLTGIATNAWNNLEKGTNRISVDTAMQLARTTGVSLDWIYQGEGHEHRLPGDLLEKIRQARAVESEPPAVNRA